MIIPWNLAGGILRLLVNNYPEDLEEYEQYIPMICISLQHLYGTWISPWYYMSISAILFR